MVRLGIGRLSTFRGDETGPLGHHWREKGGRRRVADEDREIADEQSIRGSILYKPKTTDSSAFMFHYPCLLVESGCWEVGQCRNSPPFATKRLMRATCHRKCHI